MLRKILFPLLLCLGVGASAQTSVKYRQATLDTLKLKSLVANTATPASGWANVYVKNDSLYFINDNGAVWNVVAWRDSVSVHRTLIEAIEAGILADQTWQIDEDSTISALYPANISALRLPPDSRLTWANLPIQTASYGDTVELNVIIGGDYSVRNFAIADGAGGVLKYGSIVYGTTFTDALQLDTSAVITRADGLIYWNETDGTINIGLGGDSVTLQVGQEEVIKVVNKTGGTLYNGKLVYISGSQGNRPTVALAKGDADSTACVAGMLTQDIANNGEGYVTTFGYVRQINTDGYTEGDVLWLSADSAGEFTNVEPSIPHHSAKIGLVTNAHQQQGSVLVSIIPHMAFTELSDVNGTPLTTTGQIPVWNQDSLFFDFDFNVVDSIAVFRGFAENSDEPTGFINHLDNAISFTNANRYFEITGTFNVYIRGHLVPMTTDSIQITDQTGLHYIYYGLDSALTVSYNSFPGFDQCLIAFVYWNTTIDKGLLADERHGMVMDHMTHEYVHETIGARWASGLAGTFGNSTFSTTAGEWYDDDFEHLPEAQTTCDVLYKNGSANYEWDENQTNYIKYNGGNIRYNNGNSLADVGANQYVAYWVFVTNDSIRPIKVLIGQRTDASIADARLNNTYQSLALGTLPFVEMKLLYRVILRNDATPYEETTDFRNTGAVAGSAYVATDHGTLTGLLDDDHTQYVLRSDSTTVFVTPTQLTDSLTIVRDSLAVHRTAIDNLSDSITTHTSRYYAVLDSLALHRDTLWDHSDRLVALEQDTATYVHFTDTVATIATKYDLDTLNTALNLSGIRDTLALKQDIYFTKDPDSTLSAIYPLNISAFRILPDTRLTWANLPVVSASYGDTLELNVIIGGDYSIRNFAIADGAGGILKYGSIVNGTLYADAVAGVGFQGIRDTLGLAVDSIGYIYDSLALHRDTLTDHAGRISDLETDVTGFANKALSNLTTTSINQSLIPTNSTLSLGSSTYMWNDLFLYGAKSTRLTASATGTDKIIGFPDLTGTVLLTTSPAGDFPALPYLSTADLSGIRDTLGYHQDSLTNHRDTLWNHSDRLVALERDTASYLTTETDPVWALDSANVVHFADTTATIATKSDLVDYNLDGIRDSIALKQDIYFTKDADSTLSALYPVNISAFRLAPDSRYTVANLPVYNAISGDTVDLNYTIGGKRVFQAYGVSDGAGGLLSKGVNLIGKATLYDSLTVKNGAGYASLAVDASGYGRLYQGGVTRAIFNSTGFYTYDDLLVFSKETSKTNYRIEINSSDADDMRIFGYDLTGSAYKPLTIGGTASLTSGLKINADAVFANLTSTGLTVTGKVLPSATNTHELGATGSRWSAVFSTAYIATTYFQGAYSAYIEQASAPSVSSGNGNVYAKTDNKLYYMDDGSVEFSLSEWITVKKTISNDSIKNAYEVPVTLIAAPGSGKAIIINTSASCARINYSSAAFNTVYGNIVVEDFPTNAENYMGYIDSAVMATTSTIIASLNVADPIRWNMAENKAVMFRPTADITTGGGSIDIYLVYRIITL